MLAEFLHISKKIFYTVNPVSQNGNTVLSSGVPNKPGMGHSGADCWQNFSPCPCSCANMNQILHAEEDFGLSISQPREGYRFSVDSLLLAGFCRLKAGDRVLELGAGCGVVSLVLACRYPDVTVKAVEIQEELARLAEKNVRRNRLSDRIEILRQDFNSPRAFIAAQEFDHVVSNPPYRKPGCGRRCSHGMDALARHEILTDIRKVVKTTRYALRSGGRFSVVFPAERLAELFSVMVSERLEPKRLRMIHPAPDSSARMALVEACRDGGAELRILPPLFLNRNGPQV